MSATIIQKLIRFFAVESVSIADKASAVLVDTYMKKLYSTVGAMSAEGEKQIRETLANAQAESGIYLRSLADCQNRFPHASTFQANDEWGAKYEMYVYNNITQDISYAACRSIERNYMLANNQVRDFTIYVRGIEQAYSNNKLGAKLTEINTKVNNRQRELGFVWAALVPTMSYTIEAIGVIEDNNAIKQMQDVQTTDMERLSYNQGNPFKTEEEAWFGRNPKADAGGVVGNMVGQTTYFMLPGASGMHQFITKQSDKLLKIIKAKGIGSVLTSALGAGADVGALYLTTFIYDKILKYLPIVVSTVAACIAIISWLLSLLKYFYISPFIVAYSLGTKSPQKILDFFITGVTIFFKPFLLVVFIALALVMHVLVLDVFLTLGLEQFNFIDNIQEEFWLSFIVAIIKVLFQIITPIGAIYICWKLILSGPTWTFQLIGLERVANDIVVGLSQKLERFSNPI